MTVRFAYAPASQADAVELLEMAGGLDPAVAARGSSGWLDGDMGGADVSDCEHRHVHIIEWTGEGGTVECDDCDAWSKVMTVYNWTHDDEGVMATEADLVGQRD